MTSPASVVRRRWIVVAVLSLAGLGAAAPAVEAQPAATLYERAQIRERSVRAAVDAPVSTLRSVAIAYEQIVRQYPRSGYCDNALWQAAGLLQLAWERSQTARDREKAVALLEWLRREYPSSSLIPRIPAVLAALAPPPAPSAPRASPAVAASNVGSAPEETGLAPVAASIEAATPGAPSEAEPAPTPPVAARSVPAPQPFPLAARAEPRSAWATAGPALPPEGALATTPGREAVLESVYFTPLPGGDRITLVLSQEATFTSARTATPDTIVLDFQSVRADAAVIEALGTLSGTFVDAMAVQHGDGRPLQLRLGLAGHPRFSTFPLYDPYRLVIDIEGDRSSAPVRAGSRDEPVTTVARAEPADRPEPPSSTSLGDYSLARQLGLGVSRIVIDPGHGGHDPGAQAHSVSEAELVLDVALRLEQLLASQPGFEVVVTRRTDTYVALEERTAIANREQADLFLSIHANASRNPDTRGIETYFLNFATSEEAEAVAARENASSAQAMHLLPDIVRTIATSDKVAESREFAAMIQSSLMHRIGSLSRTIKDLGVKQAPFVVLIGAEMPSALAEVSFLTNRTEASLLGQAAHRQRIAQALCDAILNYQASLKKATTVTAHAD